MVSWAFAIFQNETVLKYENGTEKKKTKQEKIYLQFFDQNILN